MLKCIDEQIGALLHAYELKTLSEEEGYDLVLDVTGAILYARPELSLDEKVAAALKAKG